MGDISIFLNTLHFLSSKIIYLAIREMQVKITLRFYLRPIRIDKMSNKSDSSCWQGCGERGNLIHCWWKLLLKSISWFPKNLGFYLPQDLATPLLGIYPKYAPSYFKDTFSVMFLIVVFIIVRHSAIEWIKNILCIYTMYYHSVFKKCLHKICRQMNEARQNTSRVR